LRAFLIKAAKMRLPWKADGVLLLKVKVTLFRHFPLIAMPKAYTTHQ